MTQRQVRRRGPKGVPRKEIVLPEIPCDTPPQEVKEGEELDRVMGWTSRPDFWQSIQRMRVESWTEIARAFEDSPVFYNAYRYLDHHPIGWYFHVPSGKDRVVHERHLVDDRMFTRILELFVMRVDPATERVEKNRARNTATRVWYEVMVYPWNEYALSHGCATHAWQLDGGGVSFEAAVIQAARRIHGHYGNDRRVLDAEE